MEIVSRNGHFVLLVTTPAGARQEFVCATETMARSLQAVFAGAARRAVHVPAGAVS